MDLQLRGLADLDGIGHVVDGDLCGLGSSESCKRRGAESDRLQKLHCDCVVRERLNVVDRNLMELYEKRRKRGIRLYGSAESSSE